MSVSELPFNTERMIASLNLWVETESPSHDSAAVNKVLDLATYDLVAMGASILRVPGRMGFGDTLRATFGDQNNTNTGELKPGVLICCHADTVHAIGSLSAMPYRREGNKLWGPGILGMKAGLVICIEVLKLLRQQNIKLNLPVTLLIVPDREAGCPSTRELIEATAKNNQYVLIPEPANPDGGVCIERHAITRYKLDVTRNVVEGIVSRAGIGTDNSRPKALSSVSEMARHLIEIEEMSTDDCSFTISAIQSGVWSNLANVCTAEVIMQARNKNAALQGSKKIMALNSANPDTGLHVNKSASLPLWESNAGSQVLLSKAHDVAQGMNLDLSATAAAGGSIGNITGGLGIATLDGLGARGAGVRTQAEHIEIDSLVERARLLAGLLANLS